MIDPRLSPNTKLATPSRSPSNQTVDAQLAELKELAATNLAAVQELQLATVKITHWIAWQKILGVLKLVFIIIPLIIAGIYLPTLISGVLQPYQELLK